MESQTYRGRAGERGLRRTALAPAQESDPAPPAHIKSLAPLAPAPPAHSKLSAPPAPAPPAHSKSVAGAPESSPAGVAGDRFD